MRDIGPEHQPDLLWPQPEAGWAGEPPVYIVPLEPQPDRGSVSPEMPIIASPERRRFAIAAASGESGPPDPYSESPEELPAPAIEVTHELAFLPGRGEASSSGSGEEGPTDRGGDSWLNTVAAEDADNDTRAPMRAALVSESDSAPRRGKFIFFGPADTSSQEKYEALLDRARDARSFDGESPIGASQREQIERTHSALVSMGDELGIDLRSRMPKIGHYHLFDRGETKAYRAAVRTAFGASAGERDGIFGPAVGILYLRSGEEAEDALNLLHETVHDISLTPILLVPDASGSKSINRVQISHGYGPLAITPRSGLTEVVTDKAAAWAWRKLGYKKDIQLPYAAGGVLLDKIIQETAAVCKKQPTYLEGQLIDGLFTGTMKGLNLIGRRLGRTGMRWLTRDFTGDETDKELLKAARTLGIPSAVQALEAYRKNRHRSFRLFNRDR